MSNNKMDKEKILLDALNTFGNFTSVEQEFNDNQLEVIYEAINEALRIFAVVEQSEQLKCHHQYVNAGTLQGDAMKKCLKCGDYVKAL